MIIDKDKVKDQLIKSFSSIKSRKGVISIDDVKLDVINHACYFYLLNKNNNQYVDINIIADAFINVASEIVVAYSISEKFHSKQEILLKYEWPPLWDVLREYFQETHGFSIDNNKTSSIIYRSNWFKRMQNEIATQDFKTDIDLNITFIGSDRNKIKIVLPMGVKTGVLEKREDYVDYYKGDELDYNIFLEYSEKEKENIKDLIIYQTKTKAFFHYLILDLSEYSDIKEDPVEEKEVLKPELANQKVVINTDSINRVLEEVEYNSKGGLHRTITYVYDDYKNTIEKKTIEHDSFLSYSFIHIYKNNKILEEQIFIGGSLIQKGVWIYSKEDKLIKKIIYNADGTISKEVNF